MFCPNCGNQMNDNAVFCSNCGWSKTGANVGGGKSFKLPIALIAALVVIIAAVFLRGGSFGSAKLITSYSADTTINQMDTVKFGLYYQNNSSSKEPIEWLELDRQGNKALLLSKYILDCKCYNDVDQDVTWETCTLRKWLNNDFYNQAFSSSEQNRIQMTNVINNNNIDYGTNGGNNTNDKIFCLSIEETIKYFGNGTKKEFGYQLGKNVTTKGTEYAKTVNNNGSTLWVSDSNDWYGGNSYFWLRSPGSYQTLAADVDNGGYLFTFGNDVDNHTIGVRPALWVSN